jgi:hypothetical protein
MQLKTEKIIYKCIYFSFTVIKIFIVAKIMRENFNSLCPKGEEYLVSSMNTCFTVPYRLILLAYRRLTHSRRRVVMANFCVLLLPLYYIMYLNIPIFSFH